jgi:hypothetical protein
MTELSPAAGRFETVGSSGVRAEIINAIADMALAARAGTLLRSYQREWAWVDQQNYRDLVDADTFNANFHAIEREFDRLAEVLSQGSPSLAPSWEQTVTLAEGAFEVTVSHGLGTTDLLVDLQAQIPLPADRGAAPRFMLVPARGAAARTAWTNIGLGVIYGFALADDDNIVLGRIPVSDLPLPYAGLFAADVTFRVRAWKLGG